MLKNIIFIFAVLLLVSACQKEDNEYPYKGIVLGENSDCGKYAIQITQGADEVKSITGTQIAGSMEYNIYIASNLPETLKQDSLTIKLNLRNPNNDEIGACSAMGIAYSWITITAAERD